MTRLMILAAAVSCSMGLLRAEDPAPGTHTEQSFTGAAGTARYWLWLPKDPPTEGAPLMVFLHGSGERGDDLSVVKKHGPPKLVESMPALQPFIIVSPQCPKDQQWDVDLLKELTESVAAAHGADRSRLYLTGLSMGGFGTWAMIAKFPDLFAAAVPICGGGEPAAAGKIKHIPIRVYHGAKDEAVPLARSQEMVTALEAAGAADVNLVIYPDVAHDSWTMTYSEPELFEWLLTKQRK